jgi:hypothetical protein
MPWQFLIRGSLILAAYKFPKFKIIFGFFVIMVMNIFCMLFLFIAWADYGTEPISVIKFEIGTGLAFLLTGWVLGVALIRQGRRKVGQANKNSSSPV